MGKDNQDYFKRAGRSGGPAGPLDHFKSALSKERAMLRRDQEHRLPGERPLTGVRQAGWLHPPQGQQPQARGGTPEQARGPTPPRSAPSSQARGPSGPTPPRSAPGSQARSSSGPTPQGAGPKPARPETARPETAQAKPQRRPESSGGLAELESRNQDPPFHELEPREQEAPYGFGIPASEEAALGKERPPHERFGRQEELRPQSPWLDVRRRPLGERMARRYPEPFRLLGRAAGLIGMVEKPVRRALDRMHTLGEIAKRS